jgi:hypothetical protein
MLTGVYDAQNTLNDIKIRMMSYRDTESTNAYMCLNPRANEQRGKRKMKNDHVPKLTGPYLSTGIEIGKSEDIILTTILADVHEHRLVAISHKFVD